MRSKLDAVKRADSDAIASITSREHHLAGRATERDGLRRQITKLIVDGLGLADVDAKSLKLTALAEHFTEPRRSQLLVAAAGLREKLQEIERTRVTTTLVTQEMLKHLREVIAVMRGGGDSSDVYGRSGKTQSAGQAAVFEAVG
jgi:hypothetical protein